MRKGIGKLELIATLIIALIMVSLAIDTVNNEITDANSIERLEQNE